MAADEGRVSNSKFFREFFLVYKSIVYVAFAPYLCICANLPNQLLMVHFQISGLYLLSSCVSLCFVPAKSYVKCICGWLNICWASKYMASWLRNYCGCSVLGRRQVLVCLGCWHCFVTLTIRARVFCRYNQWFKMVPLAVIGGACFGGIVLEVSELFLFHI